MKRILLAWLALAAPLLAEETAAPATGGEPLDVFVLVGTSNMLGVSALTDQLPEELKKPQPEVLVFEDGKWAPLQAGVMPPSKKNRFGPEVTFGKTMQAHLGRPIGIIKTKLVSVGQVKGMNKAYALVKQAKETRPIVVRGLVIQAGERDGSTKERAEEFETSMKALLDSAREGFGNPKLLTVINLAIPNPEKWEFVETVRETQKQLKIDGFAVVDCDSVERGSDKIHYTAKGEQDFGKRLAEAMIVLMPES